MQLWFKKNWVGIIVAISCIISLIFFLFYYFEFHKNGLSGDTNNWGTFGAYVGGVIGTTLSFFSVILIYITYKNQAATSLLQQFETTFFNLLSNQREILKSLSGNTNGTDGCISIVAKNLEEAFGVAPINKSVEQDINEKFISEYDANKSQLGHYFRHLYHIVKYVHENNNIDQKKYKDIIQAQMSDDELYITFYNCISDYGKVKFFPLVKQYFFENISNRGSNFTYHCKIFYPLTKFKLLEDKSNEKASDLL